MTSLIRVSPLLPQLSQEKFTPILQGLVQQTKKKKLTDLSSKESTHSNDAQNVEHSRAYNCPHTNISVGDEHTWNEKVITAKPQ